MRDPGIQRVCVVVGRQEFGESDRIIHALSAEDGRIGLFLRGGQKKPQGLDLAVRARVGFRARPQGLASVVSVGVEDARIHIRNSYARLVLAQYACELAAAFVHEGHPEPRQFALLETALLVLDAASADPGRAFLAALQLKVLTFAGVAPELPRAVERLERLRRAKLVDVLDESLDTEAEALVYDAVRSQLGRELGARALVAGIDWRA